MVLLFPCGFNPGCILSRRRYTKSSMPPLILTRRVLVFDALCSTLLHGQEIAPEQKERVDAAVPQRAPVKPKQPRRMLITNLSMRDGKPARGSSFATIPVCNYAFQQIGKRTG